MLASETGVLDEPPENVLRKGRLQPGKIFLVDLEQGRIVEDGEVKRQIAGSEALRAAGSTRTSSTSPTCPLRPPRVPRVEPLRSRQLAFGYSQEDMKVILAPLARNAEEPIGSMGNDLALAVLSDQRPLLYSLLQAAVRAGDEPADRLDPRGGRDERRNERRLGAQPARRVARARPPARDRGADPARRASSRACARSTRTSSRRTRSTSPGRSPKAPAGLDRALERICREADEALADGREHPHPLRPPRRRRPRADPGAARGLRRCTTTSSARGRACRPGS